MQYAYENETSNPELFRLNPDVDTFSNPSSPGASHGQ